MGYKQGLKRLETSSMEETYEIIQRRYGDAYAAWLIKEIKKTSGVNQHGNQTSSPIRTAVFAAPND